MRLKNLLFLFLFCLFCIAFSQISVAQEADSIKEIKPFRNSAFIELGGSSGIGFSGNYERLFPFNTKRKLTLVLRVGYGYSGGFISDGDFTVTPVEVSIFGGRRYVKPELGFGATFIDDPFHPSLKKMFISRVGIRLQKPDSHFLFKINLSGWIRGIEASAPDVSFHPIPGIVLGYSFGK